MKEINHPNICKVIEIIENTFLDRETYLIMDFIPFPTLSSYRESRENIKIPEN